jgi:hypothetical protein
MRPHADVRARRRGRATPYRLWRGHRAGGRWTERRRQRHTCVPPQKKAHAPTKKTQRPSAHCPPSSGCLVPRSRRRTAQRCACDFARGRCWCSMSRGQPHGRGTIGGEVSEEVIFGEGVRCTYGTGFPKKQQGPRLTTKYEGTSCAGAGVNTRRTATVQPPLHCTLDSAPSALDPSPCPQHPTPYTFPHRQHSLQPLLNPSPRHPRPQALPAPPLTCIPSTCAAACGPS